MLALGGSFYAALCYDYLNTLAVELGEVGRLEQERRKLIRLVDLVSRDETDDETIDRILEAVARIVLNRRSEKLD